MLSRHAITRFGRGYAKRPSCVCKLRFLNPLSPTEQGGVKMLDKDFIICKTRTELSEFIQPIAEQLDRPRKNFLRQVIGAILLSGSLVVTEITHRIRDGCSDRFYQLKRLLNHLVSFKGDLSEAVSSYRRFMSRYIQQDTPILIDMTDIAKGLNSYETCFSQKCNFVVRQRGDPVERIRANNPQCDIVWAKVHLPNNNKPLYPAASWKPGEEDPPDSIDNVGYREYPAGKTGPLVLQPTPGLRGGRTIPEKQGRA
jgi:hypothetical protein